MIHRNHLSKLLYAASAALVLAACSDRPTEPGATSSLRDGAAPDASAVMFWEVGSSVGWNGIGRDLLMAPGRPFNPFNESRVMTYLSLAQYNAIIAAKSSKARRARPSPAGAAAGASVVVLKDFFSTPAELAFLEASIAAQRSGEPEDGEQQSGQWEGEHDGDFAAGEAIGRVIGAAVVDYAHRDNTGLAALPSPQPSGPGNWTGTSATAVRGLFGTRPLTLRFANQFLPDRPPRFLSRAFRAGLAEVQGLSDSHTEEQVALAVYWNFRVARFQNEIATGLIVSHRRSERDAAHILALANMAGFDALIGCWHAKYKYWYIRPSQAAAAMTPPQEIRLPIGLPNHPSYPSGHSCVTAAYSEVLGRTFPDARPGLEANVVAAGQSRINAGIHYRFDILAGQSLGRRVAKHVLATDVSDHQPIPLD
jgi:PAP2 superfamily protein